MLMLAAPAVASSAGSAVLLGGLDSSFASNLADCWDGAARRSPVLESWEGLKDVSRGKGVRNVG